MILNPSSSADTLDAMALEREHMRKDVVYSTHKVSRLGVGRSHLFRPYRGPRGPGVTFKTKLVHRWPNLPGQTKGVLFSSIPRGCGVGAPQEEEQDEDDGVDHWWEKAIAGDDSDAGAMDASHELATVNRAYWMASSKGATWSKSTDERRIRRKQRRRRRLLGMPPRRAPPLLFGKTDVKKRATPEKKKRDEKGKLPAKYLTKSWSLSDTKIGGRFVQVIAGASNEPGPATFSEPVAVKGPLPSYERDDYSTIACTTRRLKRMQKVVTSPFKCKIPQLASLEKGRSRFVKTQEWIESQVRAKHRRSEDEQRLLRVQKKHQNLYENILNIPGSRPNRGVQEEDEFKPRPSWEIPFRITDSYESPFHKISHKTRNFTNVSPIKGGGESSS